MRNKYEWVLFDADETLFHFDAFSGLCIMFKRYGINFSEQDFEKYKVKNKALWKDYQHGKISAEQLKTERFALHAQQLQISGLELNNAFLSVMMEISKPLDGALSLVQSLSGKSRLGIITNGFIDLQDARLQRTGFDRHIELLVISEEVGVAKPHPDIFDYALTRMGNPERSRVLMVGDNLDTDIVGGINAGLDTCWLNTSKLPMPAELTPTHHVTSLADLEKILNNV